MLQRTGLSRSLPRVERRRRRGQNAVRSPVPDIPKSAGGYFFRQMRPYLPVTWQYGWRWKLLQGVWLGSAFSFAGYLMYVMFYRDTEATIAEKASRYTYVRNEQGQVVDIGYKPIVDSAKRAQRRAQRLLEEDDE
uniref:Uncharacterized protein n=1 Tax=Trypanosoma congolense (strain IL3000) TaxID=1068625 RepID=G0UZE0_TRYCI|nr:conserved hypothetical protein [Trypanosoma congolense IL3000]